MSLRNDKLPLLRYKWVLYIFLNYFMKKNSYDTDRYALKQFLRGKKHNDC